MNDPAADRLCQGQERARLRIREIEPLTPHDSRVLDREVDAWIDVWRGEDDRRHRDLELESNGALASARKEEAEAQNALSRARGNEHQALHFYRQALWRLVPGATPQVHERDEDISIQNRDETDSPRAHAVRPPSIRAGWYSDPRAVVEDSRAKKFRQYAGMGFAGCIEAPVIYGALARFLRVDSWITIAMSGILSMFALYLAHWAGIGLRQRHAADPRARGLAVVVVGWLALGAGMFSIRLISERGVSVGFSATVQGSGIFATGAVSNTPNTSPIATATVFALIYIAAGALTSTVAYYNFNPDADAYHLASDQLARARSATAAAEGRVASCRQEIERATQFLSAMPERRQQIEDSLSALAASLKSYTRSLLEASLRIAR